MSQKTLIIAVVVFSLLIVVGSYFLVANPGKSKTAVLSYSTSDKERPKIELKNTSSDMGTVKVSEQKTSEFVIKNIGQKSLQLFAISSSCDCTSGQVVIDGKESPEFGMHSQSDYVAEVAPGKEAKLKVIYRPYVMPVYGPIEREVYVSTNDPDKSKLTFSIKAYVK